MQDLPVTREVDGREITIETHRDVRNYYRRVFSDEVDGRTGPVRDRYAAFMQIRYGLIRRERDARKWADRFATGRHWHKLDGEGYRIMLDVLSTSIDGTAPSITPKYVRKWARGSDSTCVDHQREGFCLRCHDDIAEPGKGRRD